MRFSQLKSRIERQQVAQHLPLFLIGLAGAAFPSQNQRRFNPQFTRYLIGMKPLFVALGLNIITRRIYDSWDVLSAVAIQRNVGAGYAYLPLCKSQQGYSPPGRRNRVGALLGSFRVFVAIAVRRTSFQRRIRFAATRAMVLLLCPSPIGWERVAAGPVRE
jgi:hypothetical protein